MRRIAVRRIARVARAGVALVLLAAPGVQPASAQEVVDQARALLDASMPVSASSLLARELSRGGVRGDAAVLVAAHAYAEQRSWSSLRRLLAGRAFEGSENGAEAIRLLARAYAGLDSTGRAIDAYETFLAGSGGGAAGEPAPLEARIELAAAYARAGRHADAAAELERAEAEWPDLARWLSLSRLYVLADAGDAAAFDVGDRLARDRQIPTDSVMLPLATLAFEMGDARRGTELARRGGDGVWSRLAGEHIAPYLLASGDTAGATHAFRIAVTSGRGGPEAAERLLALDGSWTSLAEAGRADARAGRRERATARIESALAAAPQSERAGLAETLAGIWSARGQPRRALEVLEPWIGSGATRDAPASMWLFAARTYAGLGERARSDAAYARAAAGTGNSAALAAYLIADTHQDAGRYEEAYGAFRTAYERHAASSYGSRSLERVALIDFFEGRYEQALAQLAEYRRRYQGEGWYQGATYWSGRASEAIGDTTLARELYRETVQLDPLDYYAILAADRIDVNRWDQVTLRPDPALPPLASVYAEALDRMNRLRAIGWASRARREYRDVRERGPSDPAQTLAFARALNENGWTQEGIAQGWSAKSSYPYWTRSLLQAIYPIPFREALEQAARARNLPAHFVAGLSRRESMFDPEIVSVANAVGLMQLLPETARDVAGRAGLPEYQRGQLTVPQVNLLLGTRYLADMLDRFEGAPIAGMISYNAGPHRYVRWRDFPEFSDDEQLVERIPFRETREYVRAVTELTEIYRFLYPDLGGLTP